MPALKFGYPTDPQTVFDAIKAKLVLDDVVAENAVFFTLVDEPAIADKPIADRFITIRFGRFPIKAPAVTGGGRNLLWFDGSFTATLYCRLGTDQMNRSRNWIGDESFGALPKFGEMLGALEQFSPLSEDDNTWSIVTQPIRIQSVDFATQPAKAKGWGKLVSQWEMGFRYDLG